MNQKVSHTENRVRFILTDGNSLDSAIRLCYHTMKC